MHTSLRRIVKATVLVAVSSAWCAERALKPTELVPLTFADYREALTQPSEKSKDVNEALRAGLSLRAFAYFKADDFRELMLFACTCTDAQQRDKARTLVSNLLWNWSPRLENRDAQRFAFRKTAHEHLAHDDARLRVLALREMACFAKDPNWAQAFQVAAAKGLTDSCPDVRRTALAARLDTHGDVPPGLLEDQDHKIRAAVLEYMAKAAEPNAAAVALKYLSNADRSGEMERVALSLASMLRTDSAETAGLAKICEPLLAGTPTQRDNALRLLLHTAHAEGTPEDGRLLDYLVIWEDYSPADCRLMLKLWPVMEANTFNGDRWESINRADELRRSLMSLLEQQRPNSKATVAGQ